MLLFGFVRSTAEQHEVACLGTVADTRCASTVLSAIPLDAFSKRFFSACKQTYITEIFKLIKVQQQPIPHLAHHVVMVSGQLAPRDAFAN